MVQMVTAQETRIRKLFERQLGTPMLGMERTMQELIEWEKQRDSEPVHHTVKVYEATLKKLDALRPFEKAVERATTREDKVMAWLEYARFEDKSVTRNADRVRAQVAFERGIQQQPLSADLWCFYLDYLTNNMKVFGEQVLEIHNRAVRNCSWSGAIWSLLLRLGERLQLDADKMDELKLRACSATLSTQSEYWIVYSAYLDYVLRRPGMTRECAACAAAAAAAAVANSWLPTHSHGFTLMR